MSKLLAVDILVKALESCKKSGSATWMELEAESGVSNLGKIFRRETNPTVDTWLKLHFARPDLFPEPSYRTPNGRTKTVTISQAGTGNVQDASRVIGTGNVISKGGEVCDKCPTPELQKLMGLIYELRSPYQIKQMIQELEQEKGE